MRFEGSIGVKIYDRPIAEFNIVPPMAIIVGFDLPNESCAFVCRWTFWEINGNSDCLWVVNGSSRRTAHCTPNAEQGVEVDPAKQSTRFDVAALRGAT